MAAQRKKNTNSSSSSNNNKKPQRRPQPSAHSAPSSPPSPSKNGHRQRKHLFEAVLLLPFNYVVSPLSSLLVFLVGLCFRSVCALLGLARGLVLMVFAAVWFLVDLSLLRPLRAVGRLGTWAAGSVARLFRLPRSEARALRASVARLEQRLKAAEHQLQQHQKHIDRLLQAQETGRFRQEEKAASVPAQQAAPAPVPVVTAPLPPPPPPPAPALPVARAVVPVRLEAGQAKKRSCLPTVPTPAITMQDILRVKLKPTQNAVERKYASMDENQAGSTACLGDRSNGAALAIIKGRRAAKGLSVSLADITNVQLRRAQRAPSALASRSSPSRSLAAVGFKLKRVEGIERSPGGTPIRTEFAKSSQNNTTDKFAEALKKKFESSLINSPPRSLTSSPISSPIAPGTPGSLNASFTSTSINMTACFSPSASFLVDSSAPSPIRSDKL